MEDLIHIIYIYICKIFNKVKNRQKGRDMQGTDTSNIMNRQIF